MGLTPDSVKNTTEWLLAKRAFDAAFHAEREFNSWFVKAFRAEYMAERRQRVA